MRGVSHEHIKRKPTYKKRNAVSQVQALVDLDDRLEQQEYATRARV